MTKTQQLRFRTFLIFLLSGLFLLVSGCATTGSHEAPGVVSERIYYLQDDGRNAMVYTTSRTDYANYDLWFRAKEGYADDDYLKDFLYLFPNAGDWHGKDGFKALKLPLGSFASLEWTDLEADRRLQVDGDGIFSYRNWDGSEKTPDGHYGLWNAPDNFAQIAYSWVFPDNLEPIVYEANRQGEWVRRHNTLTFYGQDVNDLVFTIEYRPKTADAYKDLKGLEGEGVEVDQMPGGVKLTLAETLLFPTGVAEISAEGKAVLSKLARTLRERPSLNIVVSGHTDNVPIGPKLAARYPTNWELSSARSINVIHYLVKNGIAQPRFESRAFSYMRPRDTNDTPEGRQRNRRMEVFLVEGEG
jgi:chemotaxis protein MotB